MYETQKSRTNSLPPPAHRRGFALIGPKDHDRNVVSGRARTHRDAFTLIELIVVMAVIGVLVLLAAPKFLNYTARARETQIRNDIKVLESKIDEYLIKHGTLPEEWKTGGSKQGKICSLLTVEKDGPIPISLSDIEQFETKYPFLADKLFRGDFNESIIRFYKTKIDGDEVVYFYQYDKKTYESGYTIEGELFVSLDDFEQLLKPDDDEVVYFYEYNKKTYESGYTIEGEPFVSLDDFEQLLKLDDDNYEGPNGFEGFNQVYPAYMEMKIDGEDFPIHDIPLVSNMSKDLLPKYYARYDDDFNVIDDDCSQDKDSESSSSEGITGKLYDKTGPIGSMPPGNFQLVDRPFYPESKLDGNFYANNDGVVIYEDKDGAPNAGDSLDNEKPIAVASGFLLTNKNLYYLLDDSGEYVTVETDKWNIVNDIKNIENSGYGPVVLY